MEIGRSRLSEADFLNLWGILYQELYSLSVRGLCDAAVFYNTIYIICTSNSNLEDKLYWKIGDFIYTKCKEHKDIIDKGPDYLKEYAHQFKDFDKFIISVNKLGCFLNECITNKKIDSFGYLLWERVVIQGLGKSFYEDVFSYDSDERLTIIRSFTKIVPESKIPLLYYTEKYEKMALERMKNMYRVSDIKNLNDFSERIHKSVELERGNMATRFIEESYSKVIQILEDGFFTEKYYEIIYNLTIAIERSNLENIKNLKSVTDFHLNDKTRKFNENWIYNEHKNMNWEEQSKFKEDIEAVLKSNKTVILPGPYKDVPEDLGCKNMSNLATILINMSSLPTGLVIIKNAYGYYINSVLTTYSSILSRSVDDIYNFLTNLQIFDSEDFKKILFSIFRYHLQKSKPCFMERLCEYTNFLPGNTLIKLKGYSERKQMCFNSYRNSKYFRNFTRTFEYPKNIEQCKPFMIKKEHQRNIIKMDTFKILADLVSDKREFVNIYQNTLRIRLLKANTDLNLEMLILSKLDLKGDDKIKRMIFEANENVGNIKLVNGMCWAIEPENFNIKIPYSLLQKISIEHPEIIFVSDSNNKTDLKDSSSQISFVNALKTNMLETTRRSKSVWEYYNNSNFMKFKIKSNNDVDRIVKFAHQMSSVTVKFNNICIKLNIYQYIIIDYLNMKGPCNSSQIESRFNISNLLMEGIIDSLIISKIINMENEKYLLNGRFDGSSIKVTIFDGVYDISNIKTVNKEDHQVDISSYYQSLGAKILKRYKVLPLRTFIQKIEQLSEYDNCNEKIDISIKNLQNKGICDIKKDVIEYVL